LLSDGSRDAPVLLVVGASEVKLRDLLAHYQGLCERVGALPSPRVVNADHGAQRFLLFRLPAGKVEGPCAAPAQAYITLPQPGASVPAKFLVEGWAMKDVVGVAGVTITLDGKPVADATYGGSNVWIVERFYTGRSRDPNGQNIAFKAEVDASALPPGDHWLGLVVEGGDGSREVWAQQRIRTTKVDE
jgi:hypothetical protein